MMKTRGLSYYAVMIIITASWALSARVTWAVPYADTIIGDNIHTGDDVNTTDSGGNNVLIGGYAGNNNMSGAYNSFIGYMAGRGNTSGSSNVFLGWGTGGCFTGYEGDNNTLLGVTAGYCNTGSNNTFVGYQAGYNNSQGTGNTFVGIQAGYYNSFYLPGGNGNTFVGGSAGYSTIGGNDNTYIGSSAGSSNSAGNDNVFIGVNAGAAEYGSNTLYIDNCYDYTLQGETRICDKPLIYGEFDNRIVNIDGALTVGSITATAGGIHFQDGTTQTTGLIGLSTANNSFLGQGAGLSTSGAQDTYVGSFAGYLNTAGASNSFFGYYAGYSNTSGYGNAFLGDQAGQNNSIGSFNTFLGHQTGIFHTTGDYNTFLGSGAGGYNATGSGNVFLGYGAGNYETGSNKLYIANSTTSSPLIYGDFSQGIVKINGTLYMTSDRRLKKNIEPLKSSLDKVMHLQGVSYQWKADGNSGSGFSKGREIGLIAQDVERIIPELVHTDSHGYKAIAYEKMVAVLIEAIKEEQKEIGEERSTIEEQKNEIKQKDARIEKMLEDQKRSIASLTARLSSHEDPARTVALNKR